MFIPLGRLSSLPDPFQNGEALVVENCIRPNQVVFDVGANVGDWTKYVLDFTSDISVHLFEPIPPIYEVLVMNLQSQSRGSRLFPVNCGIDAVEQSRTVYYYTDGPALSTFYRRYGTEQASGLRTPVAIEVQTTTLDRYCANHNVEHIHFLKIDTEGGELGVIRGAARLLRERRINYVQFEYGGTYSDAGVTLREVYQSLASCGYRIHKIMPNGLLYIPEFHPVYEDYQYSNYLAVN